MQHHSEANWHNGTLSSTKVLKKSENHCFFPNLFSISQKSIIFAH